MGLAQEQFDDFETGVIQTILIVDDSRTQRRILSTILKKRGYQVFEAPSGEAALKICESIDIDLVISDWMMPEMDGLEFCQNFRSFARQTYGYFILLTSKTETGAVARGLDVGADDFLTKPVSSEELTARIRAAERILRIERELGQKNRQVSANLVEISTLYQSIERDLIEARKFQQSLAKERYYDFGAADVSLLLEPSGHVGGDLVGVYPAGADHVGFYALDVSGHGVASALMTAKLAGFFSGETPNKNIGLQRHASKIIPKTPSNIAQELNTVLLSDMSTDLYFTAILGHLNLKTGRIIFTQCGHPHPFYIGPRLQTVGDGGLPIGLIKEARFETHEMVLKVGEQLLLISDGVLECPVKGQEMLGTEGLYEIVRRFDQKGALLEHIFNDLTKDLDATEFPDDVSALLIEFKG